MDKHALRARIAKLERVGNRTTEQEGELKQLRRRLAHLGEDGQQRIVCDHPNAKFGDKFCRNCGEQISMPPRGAVAELLREILEEDYEISEDGGNSSRSNSSRPAADPLLDAQWEAYNNTLGSRLPGEPLRIIRNAEDYRTYGKKFHDRKSFDRATDAERAAELKRIGVSDRDIEKAKKRLVEEASRRAVASR